MDKEFITSIIDRRKRLGWSQNILAKSANVSLSALRRIEKGLGSWPECLASIDYTLKRALVSLPSIDTKKIGELSRAEIKKITVPKVDRPNRNQRLTWARAFDHCIKCGTNDTPHIARGLCSKCYDKHTELKHKDKDRVRRYGVSSAILTADYLLEHYIEKKGSSDFLVQ